jgi:hypothetical protein
MWTGLVWLRIGTGGELLKIRYEPSGYYGVVLSSIDLVS